MVKTALDLLATNKNYKNGLLTGMILGKQLTKTKKMKGGSWGGLKKALAVAAGPLGWVWLARNKNKEEVKDLKKRLEVYEPVPRPKPKPKPKPSYDDDDDFDDDDEDEDMEEFSEEDFDDEFDDFE